MNVARASELVAQERARVESISAGLRGDFRAEGSAQRQQTGENHEDGGALAAESVTIALASDLRDQLTAIQRAERRISLGTYGKSVESGMTIPDERLEAEPLAERTVEEQRELEKSRPR